MHLLHPVQRITITITWLPFAVIFGRCCGNHKHNGIKLSSNFCGDSNNLYFSHGSRTVQTYIKTTKLITLRIVHAVTIILTSMSEANLSMPGTISLIPTIDEICLFSFLYSFFVGNILIKSSSVWSAGDPQFASYPFAPDPPAKRARRKVAERH